MISKHELKYYSSLLKKKFRNQENKFIVEGIKTVNEGLISDYFCEAAFVTNQFIEKNIEVYETISDLGTKIFVLNNLEFGKISETVNPQGIAAVFNKKKNNNNLAFDDNIIVLENISDPGNVGTILRNCDWFGISDVVLSKNCADVYNPKTIRSTMGSLFHLNIYDEFELIPFLANLKNQNYKILCADLSGENIFEYHFPKKTVIVLANEAHGPSSELLSIVDKLITIPKFGKAESLNVASASAIILSRAAQSF